MQDKTQSAIKKALKNPDDGVTPTSAGRRNPVSLTSQIAALEVGEFCSRATKAPEDMTIAQLATQSTMFKMDMRNSVAASMRGARAPTNGESSIEVSTMITTPGQVYFVAIITRTE